MPLKKPKNVESSPKVAETALNWDQIEQNTSESALIDEIHPDFVDFMTRLEDKLSDKAIQAKIGKWMIDNTYYNKKPFSFKDHEYQEAIANDPHPNAAIKKCSQVGVSELSVRIMVALMRLRTLTAIYTLPSAQFAVKFSKSRIHAVIKGSEKLNAVRTPGAMSASLIQLAESFLFVNGCATMSQAISVPAQAMFNDEIDFSNQEVLGSYESRLGHADDPVRKKFSTPTVGGFGISKEFDNSDQKYRLCKCIKCNTWQYPDFRKMVVIPGFDKKFDDFTKEDYHDARVDWKHAWIPCMKCGQDLWPSIVNPAQHEWVARMPSNTETSGWLVSPLDVPKYNSPKIIISKFSKYERKQDYVNFVLGEEYSSHENQIDTQVVDAMTLANWLAAGSGHMMGVDVGKHRLHVVIGKRQRGRYCVVAIYTITESNGLTFREQLKALYRKYGCIRAVIDSEPDYTICKQFMQDCINVYPSIYVKNKPMKVRTYWDLSEDQHAITVQRTRALDSLVEAINGRAFEWPRCDEMTEVKEHFKQMKRVEETNEEDKKEAKWVKVSATDHFFHAAMYFKAACDMDDKGPGEEVVPAPIGISGISIGSRKVDQSTNVAAALDIQNRIRGLFGIR